MVFIDFVQNNFFEESGCKKKKKKYNMCGIVPTQKRGTIMKKLLMLTLVPLLSTAAIIGTGFSTWSFSAVKEANESGTANVEIGEFTDYSAGTLTKKGSSKLVMDQLKSTENSSVPDSSKDSNRNGVSWVSTDSESSNQLTFDYDFTGLIDTDYVQYTITLNFPASVTKYVDFTYKGDTTSESVTSITKTFIVQKADATEDAYQMFTMTDVAVAYNNNYPTTQVAFETMKSSIDTSSDTITASISVSGASLTNSITNNSFEDGNFTGWSVLSGTFNTETAVSNLDGSTIGNPEIPFNKTGTYFLNGFTAGNEVDTWEIKSSYFTLGGSGYVTFKMAGRTAVFNVWNAKTNEKIASYSNTQFNDVAGSTLIKDGSRLCTMTTFVADLSDYVGQNLYITLADTGTSDWGQGLFDEIVTYYENAVTIGDDQYDAVTQGEDTTNIAWVAAVNTLA